MRTFVIVPALAVALLMLAPVCSMAADEPAADSSAATEPKEGIEVGDKFSHYDSFSATTIDGKEIKLADYKGRLLFVDFWASWCAPCRDELPYLAAVQGEYVGDTFSILGINFDTDLKSLRAMAKEYGLEYPQICDEKGWESAYFDTFGIERSIPQNFLLDGDGIIIAKSLRGLLVEGFIARELKLDKPVVHYLETIEYLQSTDEPDFAKALELVNKALEGDPEHPEFNFMAASLYMMSGDTEQGIKHYETGLEHRDRLLTFRPVIQAYYQLGHTYLHEGDTDKAVAMLDAAIAAIGTLEGQAKENYEALIPKLEEIKEEWASGEHED